MSQQRSELVKQTVRLIALNQLAENVARQGAIGGRRLGLADRHADGVTGAAADLGHEERGQQLDADRAAP